MKTHFFENRSNLIFLHKLIKAFADSLLKVFVPLLILKSSGNIMLVMLYLNCYYVLCGTLNLILKKFLQKYGIIAIILHTIPVVALQFMLTASITWWWCILLAFVASLSQVLYSVPLNLIFALSDKNVDVAKFQISTNIGKIIFILLSGYVLGSNYKNSILILSIIGTILYILSSLPIFYGYNLLKTQYEKTETSAEIRPTQVDKMFNLFHSYFGIFQSILDVVIPLYLYCNNLTFEAITAVVALIEALKMLANILAKKLVKTGHSKLSVVLSLICFFIGSIVIMIVKVPVVLYICSSLIGVSFPLLFVPMFRLYCQNISGDYLFDGMIYRDTYILGTRPVLYLPYFAIPSFITLFCIGLASAGSMGYISIKLLNDQKTNKED